MANHNSRLPINSKSRQLHILCVDDETKFLDSTKNILETQNEFTVETASSVDEALEKMSTTEFDVIISDYVLPEKSGLDFLKELRESGNNIPFILFTGKGREEVAVKALNLGADRFFNKFGPPETVYGELAYGIRQAVAQREAENTLKHSEEKYRTIVELSPDGIASVDVNGIITSVNSAILNKTGFSENDFLGEHFTQLLALQKEPPPNYIKVVDAFLRGEFPESFDFNYTCKDGTQRSSDARIGLLKQNGMLVGLQVIFRDITERKKVEEALHQERQLLEHITEKMGAMIGVISPDFHVVWGNNVLRRMHGQPEGQVCYELFAKRNCICPSCGVKQFLETGQELVVTQMNVPDFNGEPHWFELYATPMKNKEGKVTAVLELIVDIDERKASEKKIDEMMKKLMMTNEKLEVVGKLTRHDARNKLAVTVNNIFLAKKHLPEAHDVLDYLDAIESVVDQMANIFDFAQIYEKLGTEELSYVDVQKSEEEAISLILCPDGTEFVVECDRLMVLADSLLRQMFYNLIDNSLKHGKNVTQIKLRYREEENSLDLIYEDNGCGIPQDEKDKIFEEGYGRGTGYGLYLIKKTCDAYGWTIKETGTHGKGAKFTLTIPQNSNDEKTAYLTT